MISLALSLVLAHLFASATAGNVGASNNFVFPSNNNGKHAEVDGSFPVGTTITLQRTSMYESVNLVLFQDGTPAFQYLANSAGLANATTFVWVIDFSGTGGNPDFELSKGERFFFEVFETGCAKGFASQYINITDSKTSSVAPTTNTGSALVSTTPPTSTSSALSISSISASFTIASASHTSTASAGGLSSGAKTGVGVGVILSKKVVNSYRQAPPQTEIEADTQQPTE